MTLALLTLVAIAAYKFGRHLKARGPSAEALADAYMRGVTTERERADEEWGRSFDRGFLAGIASRQGAEL